jgi:hypothetical protein
VRRDDGTPGPPPIAAIPPCAPSQEPPKEAKPANKGPDKGAGKAGKRVGTPDGGRQPTLLHVLFTSLGPANHATLLRLSYDTRYIFIPCIICYVKCVIYEHMHSLQNATVCYQRASCLRGCWWASRTRATSSSPTLVRTAVKECCCPRVEECRCLALATSLLQAANELSGACSLANRL